jgi:hypothetical protein
VLPVGEHLVLEREEGTAGVDEVDAREIVLLGDLLGAEVLLHGQREVRAALDRRVVCDDHAGSPLDHADPGHDPGRRGLTVVDLPRRERIQLEERGSRVDEPIDPLAGRQLAARAVPLDRCLAAAPGDERSALAELRDELPHPRLPARERLVTDDMGREDRHAASSADSGSAEPDPESRQPLKRPLAPPAPRLDVNRAEILTLPPG